MRLFLPRDTQLMETKEKREKKKQDDEKYKQFELY